MMEMTFEEMRKIAGGGSEEWHRVFKELKRSIMNETNIVLLYLKMSEEDKELLRSLQ